MGVTLYSVSQVISMRLMVYMSLKYDMSSSRLVTASVGIGSETVRTRVLLQNKTKRVVYCGLFFKSRFAYLTPVELFP